MLLPRDNLRQSVSSLRAHRLRTILTVIGLMMGVGTLITVMTIVQGASVYVEQKIANLGTNVFQVARTPFAATDFNAVLRALKNKHIEADDPGVDGHRAIGCLAGAAVLPRIPS
jgi:putative ABC transport system permease protein